MVLLLSGGYAIDDQTIKVNKEGQLYVNIPDNVDVLNNQIDIIEIQAAENVSPSDHDSLMSDTFDDEEGYKDTVNTDETNAIFDDGEYVSNLFVSDVTVNTPDDDCTGARFTGGVKIKALKNTYLKSVTKESGCTATKLYLKNTSYDLIATADFVGDVATFATPQAIIKDTSYIINADNDDNPYTLVRKISGTFPDIQENIEFTTGDYAESNNASSFNFISVVTGELTKNIVVIDLPEITGTVVAVQLVLNTPCREDGDLVDYDILDVAENEDVGILEEVYTDVVNLTSNPVKLKINLTPAEGGEEDYPSVKSYCFKVWKA